MVVSIHNNIMHVCVFIYVCMPMYLRLLCISIRRLCVHVCEYEIIVYSIT